jgi:mycothiol synthase
MTRGYPRLVATPVVTEVQADDLAGIRDRVRVLDRARVDADGVPALGDAIWRDLDRPGSDSLGLLVDDLAYAHVARSDTFAPEHWVLGVALTPDARDHGVVDALVDTAARHVAGRGGGRIVLWVLGARPSDDDLFVGAGFHVARGLHEMRAPLPIPESPEWPPGITFRDFRVGTDETAWLEVNNRAFANHPDQGAWVEATLARRMAEPWFDPSIFVLAFDADGLAGFNWCKVHPATAREPRLGEIFVIGVDPRLAGRRLGRPLALEGLARMHARGIDTGTLFTAADNAKALKLYRSLGFEIHRTDRAYELEVEPA